LGISRTSIPFLFLLDLASGDSLIRESTGKNYVATISGPVGLVPLYLLVLDLGVLFFFMVVGVVLSSEFLGDSGPVGMACYSTYMI
jgi:hypothetical protein